MLDNLDSKEEWGKIEKRINSFLKEENLSPPVALYELFAFTNFLSLYFSKEDLLKIADEDDKAINAGMYIFMKLKEISYEQMLKFLEKKK